VNSIKRKREIEWKDWLPHKGRGTPFLEVPHFHNTSTGPGINQKRAVRNIH